MATRAPVVFDGNRLTRIASGDTLDPASLPPLGGASAATPITGATTLAVQTQYIAKLTANANMTLPTFAAGDTFFLANSADSTAGALAVIVVGAGRQINGLAVADDLSLSPGEAVGLLASSATNLDIAAPGVKGAVGPAGPQATANPLDMTLIATPATPAAGHLSLFAADIAGGALPSFIGPSGLSSALQPHLGSTRVVLWSAAGNSTTLTTVGAVALSAIGTATVANVATTNLHTAAKRLDYLVTTAATTAVAGFRSTAAQYFYSSTPRMGGFRYAFVFGPATGVATATNRCFVGMGSSTAAPTDVQPSSILNQFGVGWDAADANIQIMSNDGTGTATKVDLGASFPVPTVDRASVYCLQMFCAPGSTTVGWSFADLVTGATASGTFGADMPAPNTLLAPRGWMSVGGTSSVIGLSLMLGYIGTDL